MILHNRVNRDVLKEQIRNSTRKRTTLSFYRYVQLSDPASYRDQLFIDFSKLEVLGRIYVAHEGINAQISVPDDRFEEFRQFIEESAELTGIRLNIAVDDDGKSFYKLKIQIRKKIVADGLNDETFDVTKRGTHLSAEDFNRLAQDPNTIIIDMRNHYESEVGHFENAICPDVDTFREALPLVEDMLADQKDKNLVMYCTGGIRCEKASAYYKHKGFKNVFQLDGGIIEYARQVEQKQLPNLFKGKNFVFDERLGERISDDIISVCHQCGKPADTHTNCVNEACHLLFIQCAECAEKMEGCCSTECVEVIHLPEEEQKALRKKVNLGRQVYRKGRSPKLLFKGSTELKTENK
ncbi:rhodanese-related sulfurtransferase [Fulvivirga sedimenti]|uniref:tRNA uridine(34) hydroxylase n=1 Tax=Fulvivirga sedimenti TaxID=2879465 RepID=A0A9X1HSD1_9BACT|nr:rhodanese-related sulfurtransferase [Fulvivirga sedimenti]MCA6075168.1 rhodanese-related sulfurtransferase [Fulvivirga sedimenti]MCA6076345.1 rhodanese-related sulfurtransferase [Fulvivirga sedimenti]MCA6077473.1 rhodanese-related sulfurtransferase [Fulvivirga sedimenti]